ncbi:ATP-binding cassette domain-containing protein [Candidatus Babeliales bacterium]|nr:ATP-binding cassette domain-containing protein [Candidatus Babeliales bacterium]
MIEIKKLTKAFGTRKITNELDLSIKDGEFLAIIGRSGEGKSVFLKQIIGLITPDSGQVMIDGKDVTKLKDRKLEDIFKKCGYVFQFAALLDSLNVFENIGISLLEEGEAAEKVKPLVLERIRQVGLRDDVLEKQTSELSGGMKKRVGLARTLMMNPKIIIYDEPTTGLDPITVRVIHDLIKQTQKEQKATSIVISHDIEIFNYADRVAMLHEGKIIHIGPAKEIWEVENPYVHQFIRGLPEGPIKQPGVTK